MKHPGTQTRREGACIWMDAGVINYRLCDHGHDCDTCPLDLALRGSEPVRTTTNGRSVLASMNLRFHKSHLWIGPSRTGAWVLGLDRHVLWSFSDAPAISRMPRPGRRIAKSEELFSLIVRDSALRWPSPMDLLVLERNEGWGRDSELQRKSPYSSGWIMIVKSLHPLQPDIWSGLLPFARKCRRERTMIREFALTHCKRPLPVGRTGADGGTLVVPVDQMAPWEEYLTFLRQLWELLPGDGRF